MLHRTGDCAIELAFCDCVKLEVVRCADGRGIERLKSCADAVGVGAFSGRFGHHRGDQLAQGRGDAVALTERLGIPGAVGDNQLTDSATDKR